MEKLYGLARRAATPTSTSRTTRAAAARHLRGRGFRHEAHALHPARRADHGLPQAAPPDCRHRACPRAGGGRGSGQPGRPRHRRPRAPRRLVVRDPDLRGARREPALAVRPAPPRRALAAAVPPRLPGGELAAAVLPAHRSAGGPHGDARGLRARRRQSRHRGQPRRNAERDRLQRIAERAAQRALPEQRRIVLRMPRGSAPSRGSTCSRWRRFESPRRALARTPAELPTGAETAPRAARGSPAPRV